MAGGSDWGDISPIGFLLGWMEVPVGERFPVAPIGERLLRLDTGCSDWVLLGWEFGWAERFRLGRGCSDREQVALIGSRGGSDWGNVAPTGGEADPIGQMLLRWVEPVAGCSGWVSGWWQTGRWEVSPIGRSLL